MGCKKNNMEISTNCSNNLAKDLSVIFLMYNISLTTCNSPPENAFTYHRLEWMSLQHILPKLITDIVFPPFCWGGGGKQISQKLFRVENDFFFSSDRGRLHFSGSISMGDRFFLNIFIFVVLWFLRSTKSY